MNEIPMLKRCPWAMSSQQYIDYHDKEWGVPVHDDRKLFEMLILEGVQAGLSWSLILRKRAGYLQAFDGFEASKIARYDERKVQELLANLAGSAIEYQGIGCHEQRVEAARFYLCRYDHLLRLHAICRYGERSHHRVFPLARSASPCSVDFPICESKRAAE